MDMHRSGLQMLARVQQSRERRGIGRNDGVRTREAGEEVGTESSGANPDKGSLQENPNIDTAVPGGTCSGCASLGRVVDSTSAVGSMWPSQALCNAAMRRPCWAATSGPWTYVAVVEMLAWLAAVLTARKSPVDR
jgi:hypothetical protein